MSDPGQPPEGGWPPVQPDADSGDVLDQSGGPPNPWDPPAVPEGTAGAPPPVQVPPPSYVPSAGPLSTGSSSSGASSGRRIKTASVSGRRPPGIALLGGLGLLGLLITIAIMAVLSNRVLSGTSGAGDVLDGTLPPEPTTVATAPADPVAPTTTAAGGVSGITGSATAAACQVDRDTLDMAIQAYELTTGASPTDQDALVQAGLLEDPVSTFTVTLGPSGLQMTGIGGCAGQ